MYRDPTIRPGVFSRPVAQPMRLTPAEARAVSGGGANVRHGNPGGEPASYNTPGQEGYGREGGSYTGPGMETRD